MSDWQKKRILITVKAYPNPSKKYGETVCVAGIELETNKWVRLYPVPFRDLDEDKKFKKYNIVDVMVKKATDDKRPESYKINASTIEIVDHLDTKDKWNKRKSIVLPTVDNSMCEIIKKVETENKSLGFFKPRDIKFFWEKTAKKDEEERQKPYKQLNLIGIGKDKKAPEIIPYNFVYNFYCQNEPSCPGHKYTIIDWEIKQAYRSWRCDCTSDQELLNKIRDKWHIEMCSDRKDFYFYVGNMHRFKDKFMILGTFYPPKSLD